MANKKKVPDNLPAPVAEVDPLMEVLAGLDLSDSQRRFCEEYTIDWNATRAAKAAGYSPVSAHVAGCRLLKNDKIAGYIKAVQEAAGEDAGINRQWILDQYRMQVEASVDDVYDDWVDLKAYEEIPPRVKAAIKKIEFRTLTTDRDGSSETTQQVKIEFYDKQSALKGIRDMLGMDAPKRKEITGKDGGAIAVTAVSYDPAARPAPVSEEALTLPVPGDNLPADTSLDDV